MHTTIRPPPPSGGKKNRQSNEQHLTALVKDNNDEFSTRHDIDFISFSYVTF